MPEHFDTGQKGHSAECSEAGGGFALFFYLFWYQIGWQPVGCKLKTAYISAHWKNLSFERYGNYLPFHFPRLSGWCSLWLVQPVNWLAGSAC